VKLYLMQHGEAVWEEHDPARPLTDKGQTDVKKVARYAVKHAGVRVTRIVHSGKLRARQTAEAWREHFPTVPVTEADGLDPNATPEIWSERLALEADDILLIGHLPHLARLAALLLCGNEAYQVILIQNAGLVCLEKTERGGWAVRWIITPEIV
jgi:phosphohistidine phosphatase